MKTFVVGEFLLYLYGEFPLTEGGHLLCLDETILPVILTFLRGLPFVMSFSPPCKSRDLFP